jgi:hypothetical protein
MLGPILNYFYFFVTNQAFVLWQPLTLNLSGFYHISMAAILGISAYTRGQEKIAKIESNQDSELGEK